MKPIDQTLEKSISGLAPSADRRRQKSAMDTLERLVASTQNRIYVEGSRVALAQALPVLPSPTARSRLIGIIAKMPNVTTARALRDASLHDPDENVRKTACQSKQAVFAALRESLPHRPRKSLHMAADQ